MESNRRTIREIVDSGQVLAIAPGPGPHGVSAVVWDGAQSFRVWMTFDGCGWGNTHVFTHDPADDPVEAQLWAEERLAQLLAGRDG